MLSNTINNRQCLYSALESGVHEFVFLEASRASVDEWITYLDDIYGRAPLKQELRFVVDTRQSGMLPLGYMSKKLRDLHANYDKRPPTRLVFLSYQSAMMVLLHLLIEITVSNEENAVRYFQTDDPQKAVDWLMTTA